MRKQIAAACAAMMVISPAHTLTYSGDPSETPSYYTMPVVTVVGMMPDTGWMFVSNSSVPDTGLFSSFQGGDNYEY